MKNNLDLKKKNLSFVHSKQARTEPIWSIIDAKDQYLGRIATQAVHILLGKNKIFFSPDQVVGDYVRIINVEKIKVSGKKNIQKLYIRHSGRPGGQTIETFENLKNRLPTRIIEQAIKGMLPKNNLGRRLFRRLKIHTGEDSSLG